MDTLEEPDILRKKHRVYAQLPHIILAFIFLTIGLFFSKDAVNLYHVFLGACLGTIGVTISNIISIFFITKDEIDIYKYYQKQTTNDIKDLVTDLLEGNQFFMHPSFVKVFTEVLYPKKQYESMDIIAYNSKKTLEALENTDFSCNAVRILVHEKDNEIIKGWKNLHATKKILNLEIKFYKGKLDFFGINIDSNQSGVLGFFNPSIEGEKPKVNSALGIKNTNTDSPIAKRLLKLLDNYFNHYYHLYEAVKIYDCEE
jgi:hypothetical protein